MVHLFKLVAGIAVVALPGFADLVQGTTSGTWSSTGTNVWTYYTGLLGNTSDVQFDGAAFGPSATPYSNVYLGQIELNNGVLLDPTASYSNTLNFSVDFTDPEDGLLSFEFLLQVDARRLGNDVLIDLPTGGSQSMTIGDTTYTLSLDGFFAFPYTDTPANKVTQIRSIFGTTTVAKLYGDFTSTTTAAATTTSVPEADSAALLLGMVLGGIVWKLRRQRMA